MSKNQYNFNGPVNNSIIGAHISINQNNSTNNQKRFETVDPIQLLKDIVDKSIRITERNTRQVKLEDLHNDDFTHWLRDKGYYTTDQTRSGRSLVGAGEIDILIRKANGTPVSILEAFRISTVTSGNTAIAKHINKLLNDYDLVGLPTNFVLVYNETQDFAMNWSSYVSYMRDLNQKVDFTTPHRLNSFEDISTEYSAVINVKVGLAIHNRDGHITRCFHVFINMIPSSR